MYHFHLVFDIQPPVDGVKNIERIIKADDEELARRIGIAMVGEQVNDCGVDGTSLENLLEVAKTDEETTEESEHSWERAMDMLDDPHAHLVSRAGKTVGVTLKPDTQEC